MIVTSAEAGTPVRMTSATKKKHHGPAVEVFETAGMRVLYVNHDSFLTNIQILTNAGSAVESESEWGLAHILEHMFFKGSQNRPSGTAISRAANDLGARMNAYTSYDHTAYYISALNEDFEQAFDILADMYLNPLFPEEEFRKELNPILSEFREREDDPDNFIGERALEACYKGNYHPIIGTEQSIRSANVSGMHRFKDRYYGGQNTLISVVGGVEKEQVVKLVERYFQNSFSKEKPAMPAVEFEPGEIVLRKPGIQEAYYLLLYPALGPFNEDRFKQDVMNHLFGGNDSALLFERVREELGMSCYGIYSYMMRTEPYSLLHISCGIAQSELDQLDEEISRMIQRISAASLEEHRLQRTKASIRTALAARSETSSGLSAMLSLPVLKGRSDNPIEEALDKMNEVTLEDVRSMAERTFSQKPFKAILLPE